MERILEISRLVPVVLLLTLSTVSEAAEMCAQSQLQALPSNHPECLFYTGTEHFRKKNYVAARLQWQALLDSKDLPLEHEHFRTSAYNNLGFLHYMGLGTPPDHALAIKKWTHAMNLGHEEAAYHLCHSYGDASEPEYNPKRALSYCRESLRRYGQLKSHDKSSSKVIDQLRKYIAKLEAK